MCHFYFFLPPLKVLTCAVVGRYLLCPGHLSVPATGCRLTKCVPDSAAHENTEGLQHSNTGSVLLLLQCHFGARPKAGPAPSQPVSPDFPIHKPRDLLPSTYAAWPTTNPRKGLLPLRGSKLGLLHLQVRLRRGSDEDRLDCHSCFNVTIFLLPTMWHLCLARHIS